MSNDINNAYKHDSARAYAMAAEGARHNSAAKRKAMANIVAIAADALPKDKTLDAIFQEIQALCPWVAISLSAYDPVTRNHRSILSYGYTERNLNYLDNSYLFADPAYQAMKKSGKSFFNWESTGFDYRETGSARNYWLPSGFRGGSSNYLKNHNNLYAGNLHISTDDPKHPSIDALQIIDDISPILSTHHGCMARAESSCWQFAARRMRILHKRGRGYPYLY